MEFEHDLTTAWLITLAQLGSPVSDSAWDALLARYWAPVYRLCQRYLGDPTQAEDAAQETWLRASQAIGRFAPHAGDASADMFEHWLLRIARNLCLDILRARERAAEEYPLVPDGTPAGEPSDPGPAPPEQALAGELRDAVRAAIDSLSETQRGVVRLWHAGLSYAEMARALDIPIGTVKSRMNAALARLRVLLKEHAHEPQQRD